MSDGDYQTVLTGSAWPGGKRPSTWPNGCPACWAKERSFWAGVRPDGSYTVFCMAVIMAVKVSNRFCPEHRTMFRAYNKMLNEHK